MSESILSTSRLVLRIRLEPSATFGVYLRHPEHDAACTVQCRAVPCRADQVSAIIRSIAAQSEEGKHYKLETKSSIKY
jgi:hypothetical protein